MNKLKQLKNIIITKPQKLDCGKEISNFPISYETYGTLNEKKDNAILVFHALTGDQFASGKNPITNKDGWWSYALGSGKAIDTEKFFVICANVIGVKSQEPISLSILFEKCVIATSRPSYGGDERSLAL